MQYMYINLCYTLRAFSQVPILLRRYIHYTELIVKELDNAFFQMYSKHFRRKY